MVFYGKGGKFQVELIYLWVVNVFIVFFMIGDVMVLLKMGEFDVLLVEFCD